MATFLLKTPSYLSGETHVKRSDGRDETWNDEGQDEGLQHAQEQLAHVGDVHHLSLGPFL